MLTAIALSKIRLTLKMEEHKIGLEWYLWFPDARNFLFSYPEFLNLYECDGFLKLTMSNIFYIQLNGENWLFKMNIIIIYVRGNSHSKNETIHVKQ